MVTIKLLTNLVIPYLQTLYLIYVCFHNYLSVKLSLHFFTGSYPHLLAFLIILCKEHAYFLNYVLLILLMYDETRLTAFHYLAKTRAIGSNNWTTGRTCLQQNITHSFGIE